MTCRVHSCLIDTYFDLPCMEVLLKKTDLVDAVAKQTGVAKRQAEDVLEAFFNTVQSAVKSGDRVAWPNFGTFSLQQRAARVGRNPQTGAPVQIKASKSVKFSASQTLKQAMTGGGGAKKAGSAKKKASSKRATPKKTAKRR